VNAAQIKQVPGRTSDGKDCAWIADLLRHGLLRASFVPDRCRRELRELTRYRPALVRERAAEQNRAHKTLAGANIKLSAVATDLMGVSARQMLSALCTGRRDFEAIARLAKGRLREKLPLLEQALEGDFPPHQRFLVAQPLAHIDYLEALIDRVSAESAQRMEPPPLPPDDPSLDPSDPAPGEAAAWAAAWAARREALLRQGAIAGLEQREASDEPLSFVAAVALLVTITGVSQRTAEILVSEIGTDMRRFPRAGPLCRWAGLVPGLNVSAGKRHGSKTRRGSPGRRSALVEAAHGASRSKETYLAAQYHRLAARRGKKKAIVAVAHTILATASDLLKNRTAYEELGDRYYDERDKEWVGRRLVRRLAEIGYSVTLAEAA
jgi:transposase